MANAPPQRGLTAGADALLVEYARVTESVLDADFTVVSRYGIGVDNVDIDAASEEL